MQNKQSNEVEETGRTSTKRNNGNREGGTEGKKIKDEQE